MSNKPFAIKSAASLGLELACWISDDGKISFSLSKRYKDKNTGEWKDTKYLSAQDLGGLTELAHKGLEWAGAYYNTRRAQSTEGGAAPKSTPQAKPPSVGKSVNQAVPFEDDDIPF
jgi:hypothetical protein